MSTIAYPVCGAAPPTTHSSIDDIRAIPSGTCPHAVSAEVEEANKNSPADNAQQDAQLAAAIAASLAISSPVPPPPPPSQSKAEKQAAHERLLQVTVPVHLISTPFSGRAGFDKARETKEDNHNPPHSYCYNPNTDSPQDAGGGWLQSWIKVCKRPKQTNGTVYVEFNRRKNGNYGDGKYKGWFDGQAQGGELELAETLNCTISFVGYTAFY